MQINSLASFAIALVMIGMIIGVGTLTLDKFSTAVKETSGLTNENITMSALAGTTANDEIISIVNCYDWTNGTVLAANSDAGCKVVNADLGDVVVAAAVGSSISLEVNYTYKSDNSATTAITAGRDAVSAISTDWFSLIVTIGVLSLILGITIASFAYFGSRQ